MTRDSGNHLTRDRERGVGGPDACRSPPGVDGETRPGLDASLFRHAWPRASRRSVVGPAPSPDTSWLGANGLTDVCHEPAHPIGGANEETDLPSRSRTAETPDSLRQVG